MTLVQKEPKSIKIWIPHDDYSAMQWPCDDGFHIPLKDEWSNLNSILITTFGLANTGVTMKNYLKMPYVWFRHQASGWISYQWQYWFYWTSSYKSASSWWSVIFTDSSYSSSYYGISFGMSIRPFKNEAVIPDSSWNVLYQGTWTAGIYHNSTQWLISISWDWTNRITISDKNLWATSVYNSWDTLSANNCGWFYQWGNDYMFPFTWPVTTSSTAVNASTYWPWNYYSSSTFITAAPRDNSSNDNLRWWATWVVQKQDTDIKKVYLGSQLVRPIDKNDYLCFTANTANSSVTLRKTWTPTAVTLETSIDKSTWATYTFWTAITLSNVWDKVYWRNTSETNTWFGTSASDYYSFSMSWSIDWSWDVNYLINKNSISILDYYWFYWLFEWAAALKKPPKLPATQVRWWAYQNMFMWTWITEAPEIPVTTIEGTTNFFRMFYYCSSLAQLPKLYVTTLSDQSCYQMFSNCSKIKLSTTQTWEYQTEYRIPYTWTWTSGYQSLANMFTSTWWTFTWTPSINTTYYTSNTVV